MRPMPVLRQLVASEGPALLERVAAASHGPLWSAVHQATQWRCVLPGAGQVHWRSGDELVFVDALTAFRMRPGDLYQLRHDAGREHEVYCHGEQDAAPGDVRAWRVAPRELLQLRRATRGVQRGRVTVAEAGRAVQQAMARSQPLSTAVVSSLATRARQALARHGANLCVDELAEEVRSSPFHLMRQFRRELGTSAHQYRLHLRIAAALQRLQDGDRDLAGVAHDLGFCSQSHLGDVMQRVAGCTPSQARSALA